MTSSGLPSGGQADPRQDPEVWQVPDLLPTLPEDERRPETSDERPLSDDALLQRYLDERPPHHGD